jgi:hypothetical protein
MGGRADSLFDLLAGYRAIAAPVRESSGLDEEGEVRPSERIIPVRGGRHRSHAPARLNVANLIKPEIGNRHRSRRR